MNTHQETMKHTYIAHGAFVTHLAQAGLTIAVLSVLGDALSGLGTRWEWWNFTVGFRILQWSAVVGLGAAVISLLGGLFVRHDHRPALFFVAAAGIIVGLVAAGIPLSWLHAAERMPLINDISTDMANPPQFVSIMPLRKGAEVPADYPGPRVAALQKAAYPDILPIVLPIAPSVAFERAMLAGQNLGWNLVATDPAAGRIEAMATTFWFGFRDDVVIRITPAPGGSRVDIRSVSRFGQGDLGTNAQRIREYLAELRNTSIIDPDWGG